MGHEGGGDDDGKLLQISARGQTRARSREVGQNSSLWGGMEQAGGSRPAAWGGCGSKGERGRFLQADAPHERVGMPMREPPLGAVAAVDEGDAQRLVLLRQAADLDMAPLDDREDNHVR